MSSSVLGLFRKHSQAPFWSRSKSRSAERLFFSASSGERQRKAPDLLPQKVGDHPLPRSEARTTSAKGFGHILLHHCLLLLYHFGYSLLQFAARPAWMVFKCFLQLVGNGANFTCHCREDLRNQQILDFRWLSPWILKLHASCQRSGDPQNHLSALRRNIMRRASKRGP